MKHWLVCLILLGILAACGQMPPTTPAAYELGTAVPSDAYAFPVRPGTPEWAAFRTHDEMVAACQVPETILREMSTAGLVESCLDYPLLGDMALYNSWQQGFDRVAARFHGLQELLRRPDVGEKLLARYCQMDPSGMAAQNTLLQKGQYAVAFVYIETLLAQEPVLSSMTPAARRDLLAECLTKARAKQQPDYGVTGIAHTAWVAGRILAMDAPGILNLEARSEGVLVTFLAGGSMIDVQIMGEILAAAERYLAEGARK